MLKFVSKSRFWKLPYQFIITFFINQLTIWNDSIRKNFSQLNRHLCMIVLVAMLASIMAYFSIPANPASMQTLSPEHVAFYAMINSYPQRIAYKIFFFSIPLLVVFTQFSNRFDKAALTNTKPWSIFFSLCIITSICLSIWTSNLDGKSITIVIITTITALSAYYKNTRWFAWVLIVALILFGTLSGFIQTPIADISALKLFDQHYDAVIYRGRQLAAGHLFFSDFPPNYGMLWSTLIGVFAKTSGVPSFLSLIRLVQMGQIACMIAFLIAGLLQTRLMSNSTRTVAMVFIAIACVPWLSTNGAAIWYPNQSGLRFLMIPIAVCVSYYIGRSNPIKTSFIIGLTTGIALIANMETGIAVMASLGLSWLVHVRYKTPRTRLLSVLAGSIGLICTFITFIYVYHHFFKAWPLPTSKASLSIFLESFTNSVGGLELPLRSLVIVMMAHAGYEFSSSIYSLINRKHTPPSPMTITISTLILIWFAYYMNRPDDWNLWTFIALYSVMLAPTFGKAHKSLIPFILSAFVVIPIAARNLPYFMIDPIYTSRTNEISQSVCAGGLTLPKQYCHQLANRAKTINYLASLGTVTWSTALPVLTDQTVNAKNIFWTGSIFSLSFSKNGFMNVVNKIKTEKIDYLIFDNPDDPVIQPYLEQSKFNQRLYEAVQDDYCSPKLNGDWLVAKRKTNGHC